MFDRGPFYKLFTAVNAKGFSSAPSKVSEEERRYGSAGKSGKSSNDLVEIILESVEDIAVKGWFTREDVRREMMRRIKIHLRASGYKPGQIETLTDRMLVIAKEQFGG